MTFNYTPELLAYMEKKNSRTVLVELVEIQPMNTNQIIILTI